MIEIRNKEVARTDGRSIMADLSFHEKVAPLLILVHGFKSFKNWGAYDIIFQWFVEKGFHVVKFNFSHNGGNKEEVVDFPDLEAFGKNTYSLELEDLTKVLDWLGQDESISPVINHDMVALIGHSRGGAISLLKASEDDTVKAVVTFNAVADLGERMEIYDRDKWLKEGVLFMKNERTGQEMPLYSSFLLDYEQNNERFNIQERVSHIRAPSLILHCKDDETVPYKHGILINNALISSKLILLDNGGHTLGAKHPWNSKTLPGPLRQACNASLDFFKSLGWT